MRHGKAIFKRAMATTCAFALLTAGSAVLPQVQTAEAAPGQPIVAEKAKAASANGALKKAKAALESHNAVLAEAQEKAKAAQDAAATDQKALESAQTDADAKATAAKEAEEAVTKAQEALAEAQEAKSDADAKAKSAETALEAAKSEVASAAAALQSANEAVAAKQDAYDAAQAKRALGSKAFFEDHGATAAANALATAKYASSTNMGAEGDATSLANMKRAFQFLEECNQIREHDGLSALGVTDTMMAYAQSDANWSVNNIGHAQQFNVGENLSWGYGSKPYQVGDAGNARSTGNPFCGWYDAEKAIYDSGTTAFSETGHYQNIVNGSWRVTGFAVVDGGRYGVCYGQVFDWGARRSEKVYTVAEYEALFDSYMASIEAAEADYASAKTVADDAAKRSETAAVAQKEAQDILDTARADALDKQEAVVGASSKLDTAREALAEANAASAQAKERAASAKEKRDASAAAKESADKELASAQAEHERLEDAVVAAGGKAENGSRQMVSQVTLDTGTVTASQVKAAVGRHVSTVKTIVLGKSVKKVSAGAFKGTKATELVVQTKKLTKKSVKGSLKGSKVRTVQVKVGSAKANKSYAKKYKKLFTMEVCGKKAKVSR